MHITHKRVFHDYEILEKLEVGIQLSGQEVKSVFGGHVSLEGSFVKFIGFEAFLVNAKIFPYVFARPEHYDPNRTRKLLLHKREIVRLKSRIEGAKLTLASLSIYNKGPKIKVEIGLARGKKEYEKRDKIRKEDMRRELERDFRGKVK